MNEKKITVRELISLSNFTTLRVGGLANWFSEPSNYLELKNIVTWSHKRQIICNVIGAGSNLLISDSGFNGLIISMRKFHGLKIYPKEGFIEANAGESIPNLSRQAAKAGLQGLEWAIGIPGTVGGAVVMNAGAQGGCMAECIDSIKVIKSNGDRTYILRKNELEFGYRQSLLQKEALIVLSARFKLTPGFDKEKLNKKTNDNLLKRVNSQPYHLPSCGSIFRNPEPLKAGQIIEQLGLKGHRIGGAEISSMHANFIVNTGEASASDIANLITFIQTVVQEKHGLFLTPEVKKIGFQKKG